MDQKELTEEDHDFIPVHRQQRSTGKQRQKKSGPVKRINSCKSGYPKVTLRDALLFKLLLIIVCDYKSAEYEEKLKSRFAHFEVCSMIAW